MTKNFEICLWLVQFSIIFSINLKGYGKDFAAFKYKAWWVTKFEWLFFSILFKQILELSNKTNEK